MVITLDFDCVITFQQPRFEPGMDLIFALLQHSSDSRSRHEARDRDCAEKRSHKFLRTQSPEKTRHSTLNVVSKTEVDT